MTNPKREVWIVWDRRALNKIWRKHKVTIEEVLECIKGDIAKKRFGDKYRIMGRTRDRFLTICAYKVGSTYERETYKLVTARDSTKQEKNYYRSEA